MWGRKRRAAQDTTARTALRDPSFPARHLDLPSVEVDYDAGTWLRLPVAGEDRTAWRDRALGAYTRDWALDPADERAVRLAAALDQVADSPLEHTACFLRLSPDLVDRTVVHVDVRDAEVARLEHGDPETWLGFRDVDPQSRLTSSAFVDGLRYGVRTGPDDDGLPVVVLRAHRVVPSRPDLVVEATAFSSSGEHTGDVLTLALHVSPGA